MIRKLLFAVTPEPSPFRELSMTALRIFVGLSLAFAHGLGKVPPSEGFIGGVTELGFPNPVFFAWAAGIAELVGGLFLAIGLLTRPSALLAAFTLGVAAFGRHAADPFKVKELAILYFVVFLVFAARGSGRLSVDRLINR